MAETINPTEKAAGSRTQTPPIKDPDTVQKGLIDVWGWIEKNAKLLVVLVAVLVIAVIAQSTVSWLQTRQERTAQEGYYAIEAKYTKLRDGFERARIQALMPAMANGEKAQPATGDLTKDYGTIATDLENFAMANAGTVAGAQAAILAAEIYIEYKQPEKAVEITNTAAQKLGEKHLVGSLARVLNGNALAAKGDCQSAVGAWQKVLDAKVASYLHADVGLRSGICLEKLGQSGKALEMYRKVTIESPETAAGMNAKNLLRALELKTPKAPTQG